MTVIFTNVTYESKLVHVIPRFIPVQLAWYEAQGWHCWRITDYGFNFKELWLTRATANEGYVRVDLPDGRCYFEEAR